MAGDPVTRAVRKADQEFRLLAKPSPEIHILFGSEAGWRRLKPAYFFFFFKRFFSSLLLVSGTCLVTVRRAGECPRGCLFSVKRFRLGHFKF